MDEDGLCCARRMSDISPPLEEPEGKEAAPASEAPPAGCATCSKRAPGAPEGRPENPPPRQPHTWLIDLLDDVRYLISCTNWY